MSGNEMKPKNPFMAKLTTDGAHAIASAMEVEWYNRTVGQQAEGVFEFPLDRQEGGNHYKSMAIQPVQFIHANGIGYFEGNVIKYVSRWRQKNGVQDLKKAIHYLELLIQMETKESECK